MATQNWHVELAARPVGFPRDRDFALVLRGENIGKMLVRVGPAPGSP